VTKMMGIMLVKSYAVYFYLENGRKQLEVFVVVQGDDM